MIESNNIIFIAGGGTGGHLFPAISIGKKLEEKGINIYYIGSNNGNEKKIYNDNNLKYFLLNITGIQRSLNIKSLLLNCIFPIKFLISFIVSLFLIYKYKPKAILGTGGYCSGLPLLAGITMKIPTFIQDQNSIPGLITKSLHNKINKIFLGYECAMNFLNKNKCIFTGNPIRQDLDIIDKRIAKKELQFDAEKKLIFVMGGSQGAKPINDYFKKNINKYTEHNYQILLQCGNNNYNRLKNIKSNQVKIKKFIHNMSLAYSASDIVISRAGALAISELCSMKKAMILIPYPYAAENHQKINAENLESKNACEIIYQNELKENKLELLIDDLFKDENKIKKLEKCSYENAKLDSTKVIVDKIMSHI